MRKLIPALLLLLLAATACRRPLYVAGDAFYSAILHTDWSDYQSYDPDGMTVWFFPEDRDEPSTRYTSAYVREMRFTLPSGHYTGVVIDYSPAEYGRQEFIDMDRAETALVQALPSGTQPDSLVGLYGPGCWRGSIGDIMASTGLYEVTSQPEPMALDTLHHMKVEGGEYGYYIPYEERDTYTNIVEIQHYYSHPVTPIWEMRIRIFVKGLPMIYELEASLAGLANGRFLALNQPASTPCLLSITDWDSIQTGENEGYVNMKLTTFGLCAGQKPLRNIHTPPEESTSTKQPALIADWSHAQPIQPSDLRLNLRFLLRDRATIRYYHYDVGELIVSDDDALVLYLELDRNYPGFPDLPHVEPYNSTGFDADVTPWTDGGDVDIDM